MITLFTGIATLLCGYFIGYKRAEKKAMFVIRWLKQMVLDEKEKRSQLWAKHNLSVEVEERD